MVMNPAHFMKFSVGLASLLLVNFGISLQGIIQPQSIIEIPLQITVHGMGRQVTNAFFMIYGCSDMPLVILFFTHDFFMH